ncbi:MAG: DUF378 domain-containing protein [Clostridia bacterium]|nr:DUF378 domain-containing protein [Clostridia bacterium]
MKIANIIAWILLIIGGLNWLIIGIFTINIVSLLVGGVAILLRIVYILVGLSALWILFVPLIEKGRISFWGVK